MAQQEISLIPPGDPAAEYRLNDNLRLIRELINSLEDRIAAVEKEVVELRSSQTIGDDPASAD